MEQERLAEQLKAIRRIHFVGIGGVSMSALAEIMQRRGYEVTGSDINENVSVCHLKALGIPIAIGHCAENIGNAQLVVHTAAVKADNPELLAAEERGIPTVERAKFLGVLMRHYPCPIGIAGTHGKTTTTSMLAQVMMDAKLDPTVLVGGTLPALCGNYRLGESQYLVFEACEYVDSFLNFSPKIAVILNIEEDHLDYFSGIEQIIDSFRKFAEKPGPGGHVVAMCDDLNVTRAVLHAENLVSCSLKSRTADYYAEAPVENHGLYSFKLFERGELLGSVTLRVPGFHNVKNALVTIAAARLLGVSFADIRRSLGAFRGVDRRMEAKGVYRHAFIYDDYAHHPTEITATLAAAHKLGFGRMFCVFQPHTYSRTKALFPQFVQALREADQLVLLPIYAAREPDPGDISSAMLASEIPGAQYCATFDEAIRFLKKHIQAGDIVITMGAGDVFKLGDALVAEEREKKSAKKRPAEAQ